MALSCERRTATRDLTAGTSRRLPRPAIARPGPSAATACWAAHQPGPLADLRWPKCPARLWVRGVVGIAEDALQTIGFELQRAQRERAGVSQERLAERAGIHRTYLSMIERGASNPTLTVIAALAELGMRPFDLLREAGA